jgi:cation diffusion facilitator CzcD-associated flavoprotein CzcO
VSQSQTNQSYDVVIVGAGAAGIGCGVVLKDLGLERFTILERHQVGASFSRWPEEMNFITPSFPSHGFGLLDLNAVTLKTSPAIAFRREHISGKQYAVYLQTVADHSRQKSMSRLLSPCPRADLPYTPAAVKCLPSL